MKMSVRWALVLMFALPAAATATPPAGPLQSIGLNEAVQRALAHSHELKKARHDVAEVVAKRKAAHAQLFPRLSVEGNLFIWNDKVPFEFGLPATTPQTCAPETLACVGELFGAFDVGNVRDQLTASLTVQIAQPLSGLYPLIYGHKAAKIGVKAVKTSVSITRQQIVAAARRSYLQLKQATASVAIAKSAVQQVETQLKTAQAFHKAGLLGKNDVLKVEVGLARAKGAVVQAEAAKQLATAALAIAIGCRPTRRSTPTKRSPIHRRPLRFPSANVWRAHKRNAPSSRPLVLPSRLSEPAKRRSRAR
jgi:outer membrane protein TolC